MFDKNHTTACVWDVHLVCVLRARREPRALTVRCVDAVYAQLRALGAVPPLIVKEYLHQRHTEGNGHDTSKRDGACSVYGT